MNILYLHSHDTGRVLQPYGYDVQTPALQSLADEGTLFLDAHCAAPTCSPSRAALLTGQTAHEAGMVALSHRGGVLKYPERHLANFLKQKGFQTLKAGISHVGNDDEVQGYLDVAERKGGSGEEIVECACGYLENLESEKPFFLDVGFTETHRRGLGFSPEENTPGDGDGDSDHVHPPKFLGGHLHVRRDWKDLYNSVERLDNYYGQILSKLAEKGFAEDTLVIATTDHGVAFPDMKCSLTSRGTGVLLILRAPRGLGKGKKIKTMVSHKDLFPTICELLNAEKPTWLEGKSLVPLLSDPEEKDLHDVIFSEVTFHAAFEPKRSVRSKQWNYIRNFATPHAAILPNCDDGLTKQLWLRENHFASDVPTEELYDLTADPKETLNLAENPEHKEIKFGLKAKLYEWMKRTNDPLLLPDPLVLPSSLTVNPWDQLHPGNELACEWDRSEWQKVHRSAT